MNNEKLFCAYCRFWRRHRVCKPLAQQGIDIISPLCSVCPSWEAKIARCWARVNAHGKIIEFATKKPRDMTGWVYMEQTARRPHQKS